MKSLPEGELPKYNLRILRPLAEWVKEHHGLEALAGVAKAGAVTPGEIDGSTRWIGSGQFEDILAAARALMPDDETFKKACVHRLAEAYGPMRYLLWAASPEFVFNAAAKTYHLTTTNGTVRILSSSRTSQSARFENAKSMSRLACLARQAQTAALPTLWGLPPAHLREEGCVALGDPACVYHLRWFDAKRWLPPALGLVLGIGLAVALAGTVHLGRAGLTAIPLLGLVIGYALEQHRTGRANLAVGAEINDAIKKLAEEETEARRELLSQNERQREWARMLEEDTTQRTKAFQQFVNHIRESQQVHNTAIQRYSHDLKNPLAYVVLNLEVLRDYESELGPDFAEVVSSLLEGAGRIDRLVKDLMQVATSTSTFMRLSPERLDVSALPETLQRRLKALVHGRDIRATAFKTREAPEAIETDPMLFDRVMDNILTNAAKYTERGSIIVELDGTPEALVIKVSDTGRGMSQEQLETTFRSGRSDKASRTEGSHGIGLSVVVLLLAQVGGRLEVMSKPGEGTTFWIHFPLRARVPSEPPSSDRVPSPERYAETVDRVVTIRKLAKSA